MNLVIVEPETLPQRSLFKFHHELTNPRRRSIFLFSNFHVYRIRYTV